MLGAIAISLTFLLWYLQANNSKMSRVLSFRYQFEFEWHLQLRYFYVPQREVSQILDSIHCLRLADWFFDIDTTDLSRDFRKGKKRIP